MDRSQRQCWIPCSRRAHGLGGLLVEQVRLGTPWEAAEMTQASPTNCFSCGFREQRMFRAILVYGIFRCIKNGWDLLLLIASASENIVEPTKQFHRKSVHVRCLYCRSALSLLCHKTSTNPVSKSGL